MNNLSCIRFNIIAEATGKASSYVRYCLPHQVPEHLAQILRISGDRVRGLWVDNVEADWPEREGK